MASSKKPAAKPRRRLVRIITRFEVDLLERLDTAAADMGLNRTAFIVNACAERLLQLERGSVANQS
jgi:uncharacterized protein (DUF1778 family)